MTKFQSHLAHAVVRSSLLGVGFALLLSACSSGITVRADISPNANFSQFETYGFFKPMGIEGGYNSPIFGEVFRDAISKQMEARGYTLSKDPDLQVNVTTRFDEKVKVTMYTAPYMSGAYYGGPGGASYGSGLGVGVGTGTRATRTEEVSVFIDLVDNAGDRIAWQGVSVIEIDNKKAQKLKETVDYTVNKVFELYPHTAGN